MFYAGTCYSRMRLDLAMVAVLCMLLVPVAAGLGDVEDSSVAITRPRNGFYLFDLRVLPLVGQVVIGQVTVEVSASEDVDRVVFLVPPKVGCRPREIGVDGDAPFDFLWRDSVSALQDTGLATLMVWGYSDGERVAEDAMGLLRFAA